ncbi:MAG: peptide deformylase [Minisyncoccia bacterium]
MIKILTILNKKEEEFLRTPTKKVPLPLSDEHQKLIEKMKVIMKKSDGVGLAANQIGVDLQIAIVEYQNKSYTLINPKIIKLSKKMELGEEGCLSVPGCIGVVPRAKKIVVETFDKDGKKIKIKEKDMLARIIQHEIDHLNGILFVDKAKEIYYSKNYAK